MAEGRRKNQWVHTSHVLAFINNQWLKAADRSPPARFNPYEQDRAPQQTERVSPREFVEILAHLLTRKKPG